MEQLTISNVEKQTNSKGSLYLKLTLADNSVAFAWDAKTFGALESASTGSIVVAEVDRSGKYARVLSVHEVRAAPTNGHQLPTVNPVLLDRDRSIRRQVALKCAIEAAGLVGSTEEAVAEYVRVVRRLADDLVEWLEEEEVPF